jgi:hypothetical protein
VVLLSSGRRDVAALSAGLSNGDTSSTVLPQNSTRVELRYLKTQGDSSKGRISEGVLRRSRLRECAPKPQNPPRLLKTPGNVR